MCIEKLVNDIFNTEWELVGNSAILNGIDGTDGISYSSMRHLGVVSYGRSIFIYGGYYGSDTCCK